MFSRLSVVHWPHVVLSTKGVAGTYTWPLQDAGRLLPDKIHATTLTTAEQQNKIQRVVVVGDVHGCLHEMQELLQKVNFTQGSDLLLFNGDMVNKGPYPVQVSLP